MIETYDDIINRDGEEDGITILKGDITSDYYRFFARNIENEIVTSHGYPEHTRSQTASGDMSIDSFDADDLQLGNANTITTGFSGAPVLYEKKHLIETVAVGMIDTFLISRFNRLQNIALALSADLIIRYTSEFIKVKSPNLFIKNEDAEIVSFSEHACYPGCLEAFCESDKESLIWGVHYGKKYKDALSSQILWNFASSKHNEGWDVFFTSRNIGEIVKLISSNDCYNSLIILYHAQKHKMETHLEELEDSLTGRNHKIKLLLVLSQEQKNEINSYLHDHAEAADLLYKDENDQLIPFFDLNQLSL